MNINSVESTVELTEQSHTRLIFGTAVDEKSSVEQLLLSMYDSVQTSIFVVDVLENGDFCYVGLNPTHERWIGISSQDLRGKKPEDILTPVDAIKVRQRYTDCVRLGKTISYEQCLQFQGVSTWWSTTLTPLRDANSRIYRILGTSSNITPIKQVTPGKEQLLAKVTQRIHDAVDFNVILQQTVEDLRLCLNCDRILIYQMSHDHNGVVIAEATVTPDISLLGKHFPDPCLRYQHQEHRGRCCHQIVTDIYTDGINNCQRDFLNSLQVRAHLVVPILLQQNLWGLLIAQYCHEPHQWQQTEIDLLQQIASQLGIATHQQELQQQIKQLKNQLELHKQEHHTHLQQTKNFQSLVLRVTEKIRDHPEEKLVFAYVTQELTKLLQLESCYIELYSPDCAVVSVVHEYAVTQITYQGLIRQPQELCEIYQPLMQKQPFQSVEIVPGWHPKLLVITQLACPIYDKDGILGNLWVIKPTQQRFEELEIDLVQTLAHECAIAIRQTRLNASKQARIKKLETKERLNQEFLKNLSHELQTPITSISLAAQTLESLFLPNGTLDTEIAPQLLQILHKECGRESRLINDLLTLIHLEVEPEPPTLINIDLQTWLPPVVAAFLDVTSCQGQQLKLDIATNLTPLVTDITELERILTELLNYVCKYTPPGESITVSTQTTAAALQISVSNSGLEISTQDQTRIFEPFYHLSKNDPWKYSGTGLEMALVKKMVRHLGGSIHVESGAGQTTFMIKFPQSTTI
ncbi:ATPase [Nostoc sp. CENA543]|uniref:GAF domain-containing protein n=1 Tax=Nostoc sp. CENA543 TaxID=1869241 RepID=UPI000CA24F22|nr:GAF domain-containing protein [Nostoc sp. CENA543]AUT00483.1 ATPase [Nostoc sp. CENA543]